MFDIFMDEKVITALMLSFLCISIFLRVFLGLLYRNLIRQADNMASTGNKMLKQCKLKFANCYQLSNGVANIPVFVDKFMNRIRFMGMSMGFMKHLSGQLMLAGVFVAGFGVCKGIVEGISFISLLPFYIISLFGIYLYLSIVSIVDMPNRKQMLKTNLTDYLENTVAQRLEHGILEKEKLMWELAQEKSEQPKEEDAPVEQRVSFSQEEARELEELLRSFIGNKA